MSFGDVIRIGARNSPLSRAQVDLITGRLAELGVRTEFVPISTQGDVDRRELTQIGGTGVFVGAVRDALLDGTIDVGVHSTKDLPTQPVDGLEIVAHPAREDTRDVLVGLTLTDAATCRPSVPIRVGTGAPRRVVQLEQIFADRGVAIQAEPVRGNVDTRVGLVRDGKLDGVVLAAAGLRRLGRIEQDPASGEISVGGCPADLLPADLLLPAPGQGALAVETASSLDSDIRRVLTRLDDAVTRAEVLAERRFLAVLEAGCTAPVGARASVQQPVRDSNSDLTLATVIGRTREDGFRFQGTGRQSERVTDDGDRLIDRGKLITVTGTGLSAAAADLGDRLGRFALTEIDIGDIRLG
jgi:hydroxymethylbilane synthase